MAMAEERGSTPDQTPGPSRAHWMEGGGTVRLHHQRQLGLFTARGICMRTLRIPSIITSALLRASAAAWNVRMMNFTHIAKLLTLRNYSCAYLELRRTLRYAARYAAPVKIEIYSGPLTRLGQFARNYINPPLSILILSLRLRWHMMSSRTSSFNTGPLQN